MSSRSIRRSRPKGPSSLSHSARTCPPPRNGVPTVTRCSVTPSAALTGRSSSARRGSETSQRSVPRSVRGVRRSSSIRRSRSLPTPTLLGTSASRRGWLRRSTSQSVSPRARRPNHKMGTAGHSRASTAIGSAAARRPASMSHSSRGVGITGVVLNGAREPAARPGAVRRPRVCRPSRPRG